MKGTDDRPELTASLLRRVFRHMEVTNYFANHCDDFRTLNKDLTALIVRHEVAIKPTALVKELLRATFWSRKVSSEFELVAYFSKKELTHFEFTEAVSCFVLTANLLLESEERCWVRRNNVVQKIRIGAKVSIGNNVELRVESILQGDNGYYWAVDLSNNKGRHYKFEELEELVFAEIDKSLTVLSAPESYTYKKGC